MGFGKRYWVNVRGEYLLLMTCVIGCQNSLIVFTSRLCMYVRSNGSYVGFKKILNILWVI